MLSTVIAFFHNSKKKKKEEKHPSVSYLCLSSLRVQYRGIVEVRRIDNAKSEKDVYTFHYLYAVIYSVFVLPEGLKK